MIFRSRLDTHNSYLVRILCSLDQVVIAYGLIASSVAIMNDWHLDKMSDAAKQNTMCHEIG